jgi:exodeoxyribonuclease VII large subunit
MLSRLINQALEIRRLRLERLASSSFLREPRRILTDRQQQVDQLETRLLGYWKATREQRRERIANIVTILSAFRPDRLFEMKRKELAFLEGRLKQLIAAQVSDRRNRVAESAKTLRLLGPQQTLERGYSITMNERAEVIRSIQSIGRGEKIRTRLVDGEIGSTVNSP